MSEGPITPPTPQEWEKLMRERNRTLAKERTIQLARVLIESQEKIPFPGIDPEALAELKAADADDPGYMTPLDELLKRFEVWGMKIAFGKYPESGNVYILPNAPQPDDIENDGCIRPKHLNLSKVTNEGLKELILLWRG